MFDAAFVWSSGADIGGGPAFLRAIARDDELGLATESRAPSRAHERDAVLRLVEGPSADEQPPGRIPLQIAEGRWVPRIVEA